MRPGPARGTTETVEVVVDASMTDAGHATEVADDTPPVLGSLALAAVVTRACRDLLAPHLDAQELAVPGRLDLIHRTPIPVGTPVRFEVTVQMVEPTRVTCEVLLRTPSGVAARASYEQEVLTRDAWLARMPAV
jgi:predicted thioesterase